MNNFDWKIKKTSSQSRARAGIITTPHGKIDTPAFIFCGTKAALKSINVEEARKCGIAILNNVQAIKEIQEHDQAISGLDVLGFKVDQLRDEIATLRDVDREIMTQHEKIFEWMTQQGRGGSGYGGG